MISPVVLDNNSHMGLLWWLRAFDGLFLEGRLYVDGFLEFEVSGINKFPFGLILVN